MSDNPIYRRGFLEKLGIGSLGAMITGDFASQTLAAEEPKNEKKWEPVSDRKIRFGIVGYDCRITALSAGETPIGSILNPAGHGDPVHQDLESSERLSIGA